MLIDKEEAKRNFAEWFGDSKVVDQHGRPLIVYHGTATDLSSFSSDFHRSVLNQHYQGDGFHFSASPEVASEYATANRNELINKDRIFDLVRQKMPPLAAATFIAIVNDGYDAPWQGTDEQTRSILDESERAGIDINTFLDIAQYVEGSNYHKGRKQRFDASMIFGGRESLPDWVRDDALAFGLEDALPSHNVVPVYLRVERLLRTKNPDVAKRARDRGFDGVLYYGEGTVHGAPEYIVFEPTQIKSIFNSGIWDPDSPSLSDHHSEQRRDRPSAPKG